jgi:hypothetical protein
VPADLASLRIAAHARRDLFAQHALAHIPKILTLMDRNAHSPTYGCFDRKFWHYKIIDFPSGMSQEYVWPLALAYHADVAGNPYHRQPIIQQWVHAGIAYAARSAHPDASCDDYFPFEKAAGAAAFSLLSCIESYQLMGLDDPDLLRFFERRADWLADHHESGRLSNHQALIVLCLLLAGRLLKIDRWDALRQKRLDMILQWQSPEGWFPEYEGCDPGYQTLTIYCLARVFELTQDERLRDPLARATRLAAQFVHPDGSFGGEYTSRNTYNFFPAGFELVGRWLPESLAVNDLILRGLEAGLGASFTDDQIIGHHTWNYLLAWEHFVSDRPSPPPRAQGRLHLPQARLLIDRRNDTELFLALNKGGVFKLFREGRLVASDTQVSLQVKRGGKQRTAVANLVSQYATQIGEDRIVIEGSLGWAKQKLMSTFNLLVLRVLMLTVGRFNPDLVRRMLQKVLIVGKKPAPFTFRRTLTWREGRWTVRDEVTGQDWSQVSAAGIGPDQTSIYVVMSRTFQPGQMQPWIDLTQQARSLKPGQALTCERTL